MVDGLERVLGARPQVIRLSTSGGVGRSAAIRYQVRVLPTFVVVDTSGEPVLATGGITSRDTLLRALEPLLAQASD